MTKAPSGGANGTFKYSDGLSSTDYFNRPPFITAPPNPQIAVGPDDILTVVNRTIARYPNPNAGGANAGWTNPYFNPPSDEAWLDVWLGITALASLCPSGTGNNAVCVIDNASIRYDQLQGRFVVLFTVTDMPAHRSNFVLLVSKYAQFNKCANTTPTPVGCPNSAPSSPLFTPPVIAPYVGGTATGGINGANWYGYTIPINVTYITQPTVLGNGVAGLALASTGGTNPVGGFVATQFCGTLGGPALPLSGGPGGTLRSCTNYFPTGARMGLDNDNILLTAPVLDQMGNTAPEGTLPIAAGANMGPYVGTRVVSVAKLVVYNGTSLSANQPAVCTGDVPSDCTAINLSDNVRTGTLTNGGAGGIACNTNAQAVNPGTIGNCSPGNPPSVGTPNPISAIFWEPDNLRGRALASFDAQVGPAGNATAGVITPIDYLVGNAIYDVTGASSIFGGTQYFLQPIIYSCPATGIYPGPSGVEFCGTFAQGQVADLPVLGPMKSNVSTLATVNNPNPVGQGLSAANMVANDGTPTNGTPAKRLFVGDMRPQQVLFREGLLYVARSVRLQDNPANNSLGSSTVLYDIIRTCATSAANPVCGAFSASGATLINPALALETEWTNGQAVPDTAGDIPGFGFYAPMFESPADVTASGPTSPISIFPWLEKLFVGMTTGGTSNLAATFSKDFPSLWDFRPGDDIYDTVEPYIDPYIGIVDTTVACPSSITVAGTETSGSKTLTNIGDTTGLGAGMFVSGGGAVAGSTITSVVASAPGVPGSVTLSSAPTVPGGSSCTNGINPGSGSGACVVVANFTFSRVNPSVTSTVTFVGTGGIANQITLSATNGILIGQTIASGTTTKTVQFTAASTSLTVLGSTSGLGVGETVSGAPTLTITGATTLSGSANIVIPVASPIAIGETVSGGGLTGGTTVTGFILNPADNTTLVVTLSNASMTATGATSLTFSSAACFSNNVVNVVGTNSTVTLGTATGACSTLSTDGLVNNGIVATFTVPPAYFTGAVTNIAGSVITLSVVPGAPASTVGSTSSYPVVFGSVSLTCPMIPWSSRGGASTDPNDGSLWLYGEFAKQRLSTVPGPGEWGTSFANYELDFPAVDPYDNDNTFFGDVPSTYSFFTWIQIAKNLGLAQPTALGPCPTSPAGNPPIQQPPAGGSTPNPGTSALLCPYFSPTQNVTRAEMAYWVVRSQMDEPMITAYLAATGGDPSLGITASSFADLGTAGGSITNPFLPTSGITQAMMMRYIEVMYRRGYTKGCSATDDPLRQFCPNTLLTRGQMSVFLIRAKMNNVFPTTLSGIPLTAPYGDNFGLFTPPTPYFSDVTTASTDPYKDYYIYIQKMRELRITNGTGTVAFSPGANITRQEITTFIIRAFFL